METDSTFTKQYSDKQDRGSVNEDIIVIDDNSRDVTEQTASQVSSAENESLVDAPGFIDVSNYDEPIDLTSTHDKSDGSSEKLPPEEYGMVALPPHYATLLRNNQVEATPTSSNANFSEMMPMQCISKHRGRRRRFEYDLSTSEVSQVVQSGTANGSMDLPKSESKQVEVLKAAKSLFSKRTRTLYHWMYPNAPKARIKAAVASSWESLGSQEKEFYVSQVLGRFGFPQCNLMINPQLGGIKELAPLPEGEYSKQTTSELQSAISSISSGSLFDMNPEQERSLKRKRRPGRPSGSRTRKYNNNYKLVSYSISQDFQDDPELSKELEQFALTLNMNNGVCLK